MLILDANIILQAHFTRLDRHADALAWLDSARAGSEAVGVPEITLLAFVRVATNRRTFPEGPSAAEAFDTCEALRLSPSVVMLSPGKAHWRVFEDLVAQSGVTGADMTDAYLAAFAIENDAEFVTFDRGFARFRGLRWSEPPAQ